MRRKWLHRSLIKRNVRAALSGNVLKAFCACLIPLALSLALYFVPNQFLVFYLDIGGTILGISGLSLLLSFAVGAFALDPMAVRLSGYFLQLGRDPRNMPSPLTVCDCFGEGYGRLVRGMLLRWAIVTAVEFVPPGVFVLLSGGLSSVPETGALLIRLDGLSPFLTLAAALLGVYLNLTFVMVPYILADQPDLTVRETLRESRLMMRGRRIEYIVLELSFFAVALLVPLTMLAGAIYVLPFLEGTTAAYYIGFQDALASWSEHAP